MPTARARGKQTGADEMINAFCEAFVNPLQLPEELTAMGEMAGDRHPNLHGVSLLAHDIHLSLRTRMPFGKPVSRAHLFSFWGSSL